MNQHCPSPRTSDHRMTELRPSYAVWPEAQKKTQNLAEILQNRTEPCSCPAQPNFSWPQVSRDLPVCQKKLRGQTSVPTKELCGIFSFPKKPSKSSSLNNSAQARNCIFPRPRDVEATTVESEMTENCFAAEQQLAHDGWQAKEQISAREANNKIII